MISLRSNLWRALLTHYFSNQSAHLYVRELTALLNVEAHRTNRSMKTTRPQSVNRKQVEQLLASAQNQAIAARKNLDVDAEAAYQIAYEAMLKGYLALMLIHDSRSREQ